MTIVYQKLLRSQPGNNLDLIGVTDTNQRRHEVSSLLSIIDEGFSPHFTRDEMGFKVLSI